MTAGLSICAVAWAGLVLCYAARLPARAWSHIVATRVNNFIHKSNTSPACLNRFWPKCYPVLTPYVLPSPRLLP